MLLEDHSGARWCGIRLGRHPTAVRRGVSGFRIAQHLHRPVTHDKQAEAAGRKRYDALIGKWAERFGNGLQRRRVVLHAAAGELYIAVNRDGAPDSTQSEAVGCIRRLPRLGYGKLSSWDRIAERAHATLIAARGSHVRASDGSVRINDEHSCRLPVRHAHHRIDLDGRAQFGGQHVFALHRIPTTITDIAGVFDQHHHAGVDDREALRIVQGYGKLLLLRVEDVDGHGDAVAQRRDAAVPCDNLESFC